MTPPPMAATDGRSPTTISLDYFVPQAPPGKQSKKDDVKHVDKAPSALFFKYNTQLGPPYRVLIDTNFINFSIRNKIDLIKGMMDCLYAECTVCVESVDETSRWVPTPP